MNFKTSTEFLDGVERRNGTSALGRDTVATEISPASPAAQAATQSTAATQSLLLHLAMLLPNFFFQLSDLFVYFSHLFLSSILKICTKFF